MAGLPSAAALTPFFRAKPVPFRLWIVEGAETVTGSYRTPSGTTGGAVHGPRTVPTASGRAREILGGGKGLILCADTHAPETPRNGARCMCIHIDSFQ